MRDLAVFTASVISLFAAATLTPMRIPFSNYGYTKTAWTLAAGGMIVVAAIRLFERRRR
jgi:hypothetical protein